MRGYIFSKVCFIWLGLVLLALLPALPAQAVTYTNSATAFSWIDPSAHTRATWTSGASCSAGYAGAPIDDDITAQIPLGFTFNYGGVDYTQVQIMSNGRLQFNNGYCGYGTQTVGPPPTYPYPYPDANLPRTMRIYGVDLDATPTSASGICPTATCYVSYSTVGSAPNRQFVVTWVNVPEWGRTARTGSFNLQVILYETTNEFVYQFGTSSHPTGGSAQIGWELTTSDYLVWATTVVPTASTAVRFYIPSPVAEFRMDESAWSGAGSVINSVTSGTNGSPVGAAQTVSGGKLCRGGNIPANTSTGTIDAVDSGLDVDTQIGSSGTITFWYKSNAAWDGGGSLDSQLFDATTVNNRWFYLVKQQGNGRLRFNLTDSANNNFEVQTGNNTVAANTWTHIAVTWNLTPIAANNRLRIYINGTLAQSTAIGTTNPLSPSIGTLYLGDNRSGFVTNPGTGNSANGVIDEARIYNYEATSAVILRDYNATRSCPAMDHIRFEHDGAGVTCAAEPVTIKACANAACSALYTGSATVTLSGSGWATNPVTFTTGSAVVNLSITSPQTVTLGTTAVAPTPSAGLDCFNGTTTNSTTACQLPFADTGFIFSSIPNQAAGVISASLTMQAVKKADNSAACVGLFTGNVAINMASQCVNPTTCAGKQITINSTAIANNPASGISSYTPVTLNFGANSTASFTLNYPDVGQMSLSARYLLGGSDYMTGSSSAFVVRPYGFALSNIIRTADSFANPGAAGPAGTAFIKAGDAFSATVTAQAYGGTATPNYGKEIAPEGVRLTTTLVGGLGLTTNPVLNNATAFGTFTNGVATGTTFSWDEVGIITLTPSVADGDYLGAGNVASTASGNVGRFIPHHFALAGSTLTNRSDLSCAPASTFTYMGEPFNLAFTLTAQNASNSTTQNYATANSFAKLDGAADPWTSYGINRSLGMGAIDNAATKTPAGARLALWGAAYLGNCAAPSGSWVAGLGSFSGCLAFSRAATADGPFEFFDVGLAPQDADGVQLLAGALNLDADNSGSNERALLASTKMRYGRMRISNAYGSELLPLPMPLKAEYRGASGFRINSDDSCTPLVAGDFTLSNPTRNMTLAATSPSFASPLVAGDAKLKLSAPGSGKNGSIDMTVTVPAWLQYNWKNAGDENPTGRAVFGIYQSPVIYMRENY